MTRYETVRDTMRAGIADMRARHDAPCGLSACWPDGSPADRARLAREIEAEFGLPVEIVARPEDAASEIGRAAIREARRARRLGDAKPEGSA